MKDEKNINLDIPSEASGVVVGSPVGDMNIDDNSEPVANRAFSQLDVLNAVEDVIDKKNESIHKNHFVAREGINIEKNSGGK